MARQIPRLELLERRLNPSPLVIRYPNGPDSWDSLVENRSDQSIVFLDESLLGRVPYEELTGSKIVLLNHQKDLFDQISSTILEQQDIATIRLITHGSPGTVHLGNQIIDTQTLTAKADEIAQWKDHFTKEADILLYGCSVAETAAGKGWIDSLARLTGADVAASNDPTGAGGNLVLEYSSGKVSQVLEATKQAWEESRVLLPSEGGYNYTISNGNATISGYTGPGGTITVPGTLGGLPVIAIGDSSFISNHNLTMITLPDSLTSIGRYAFSNCGGLTSIIFGNSLTSIGFRAFQICINLTTINLPERLTSIDGGAFQNCTGLTSIPLPDGLTTVGDYAFFFCSSLTRFEVGAGNQTYSCNSGILYNKAQTTLVYYPPGKQGDCPTLPTTVTTIGLGAFDTCTGLTSITLPNSLTSIGGWAFSDCQGLVGITLGNSLISLGTQAFWGCVGLTAINLPDTLITIGDGAFNNCVGLTIITLPDSLTTLGIQAFIHCGGLTSITLGNNLTTIGDQAFDHCTSALSLNKYRINGL